MKSASPTTKLRLILITRGLSVVLLFLGGLGLLISGLPVIISEIGFELKTRADAANSNEIVVAQAPEQTSFGEILVIPPQLAVTPINTENSLIIEKIDVNSPIIWDVDVRDKNSYNNSLKSGVAHAYGTQLPSSEAGNTYLFAHSTLNPLEIVRYAATFTLLHRLEVGDRITAFSQGIRYDYIVEDKSVVDSFNTEPLKRQPDYPMLTLQTCDPPGIPLNRLIITARLAAIY